MALYTLEVPNKKYSTLFSMEKKKEEKFLFTFKYKWAIKFWGKMSYINSAPVVNVGPSCEVRSKFDP